MRAPEVYRAPYAAAGVTVTPTSTNHGSARDRIPYPPNGTPAVRLTLWTVAGNVLGTSGSGPQGIAYLSAVGARQLAAEITRAADELRASMSEHELAQEHRLTGSHRPMAKPVDRCPDCAPWHGHPYASGTDR